MVTAAAILMFLQPSGERPLAFANAADNSSAQQGQGAKPTFYRDVLPILENHCQVCHRPGEIAPAPLVTYEQTRPWAAAIKQAVQSRQMPPWFSDPRYGRFSN